MEGFNSHPLEAPFHFQLPISSVVAYIFREVTCFHCSCDPHFIIYLVGHIDNDYVINGNMDKMGHDDRNNNEDTIKATE